MNGELKVYVKRVLEWEVKLEGFISTTAGVRGSE
jgi:hypothetical protein